MFKHIKNHRKTTICIVVIVQLVVFTSYVYVQEEDTKQSNAAVTFIEKTYEQSRCTYHTWDKDQISLPFQETRHDYVDFNSSLCYRNGTDLKSTSSSRWQCKCMPGWHGKDCGQPEMIMRAFLTYKKRVDIAGPRSHKRRVVYAFPVDEFSEMLTEIRVKSLGDVVDLFVFEEESGSFMEQKLNNGFLKEHHHKIYYIKNKDHASKFMRNLQNDDIIIYTTGVEIYNRKVIEFLKNYNNWPEPLGFRLRWSLFGFFWLHPSITITTGHLCTISHFKKVYNHNYNTLNSNKTKYALVVGGLTHFGGWYCQLCMDIQMILQYLIDIKGLNLSQMGTNRIDTPVIEEWIENGVYIDGKTELIRARKYQDKYFAPDYVMQHEWKYDFLLVNFYTKLDYYEG